MERVPTKKIMITMNKEIRIEIRTLVKARNKIERDIDRAVKANLKCLARNERMVEQCLKTDARLAKQRLKVAAKINRRIAILEGRLA